MSNLTTILGGLLAILTEIEVSIGKSYYLY